MRPALGGRPAWPHPDVSDPPYVSAVQRPAMCDTEIDIPAALKDTLDVEIEP